MATFQFIRDKLDTVFVCERNLEKIRIWMQGFPFSFYPILFQWKNITNVFNLATASRQVETMITGKLWSWSCSIVQTRSFFLF